MVLKTMHSNEVHLSVWCNEYPKTQTGELTEYVVLSMYWFTTA